MTTAKSTYTVSNTFEIFGDACPETFDSESAARAQARLIAAQCADMFYPTRQTIAEVECCEIEYAARGDGSTGYMDEIEWSRDLYASAVEWSNDNGRPVDEVEERPTAWLPLADVIAACEDAIEIEEDADDE